MKKFFILFAVLVTLLAFPVTASAEAVPLYYSNIDGSEAYIYAHYNGAKSPFWVYEDDLYVYFLAPAEATDFYMYGYGSSKWFTWLRSLTPEAYGDYYQAIKIDRNLMSDSASPPGGFTLLNLQSATDFDKSGEVWYLASEYSVLSGDSGVNFQRPLSLPHLQTMTEAGATRIAEEVPTVAKILVFCGVGCLISLAVLIVLKKVFWTFRAR